MSDHRPSPRGSGYGQQLGGLGPLANWGQRVLSGLVDLAFIAVPQRIVQSAVGGVRGPLMGDLTALIVIVCLAYLEGTTGQTPGKRVVGTRTVREADFQVLGFERALGRKLLHFLDALVCCLGYLWPAWDEKRQTFADKFVSSVVIKP